MSIENSSTGLTSIQKPSRRVRVSQQRQITIPKEYYDALVLGDEALVEFTGKSIVIRPAEREEVDFSANILEDLIEQGYSDRELLNEFKRIKADIPKALSTLERETMEQKSIHGSLDEYLDSLADEDDE